MNPHTLIWEDAIGAACVYTLSNEEAGTYYTYASGPEGDNLLHVEYLEASTEHDAMQNHNQAMQLLRSKEGQ